MRIFLHYFTAGLLLLALAMPGAFAYDFSAVSNGKTLYYNITSRTEPYAVEVTRETANGYSTSPTGDLTIPSSVTYRGITYSVTSIGYTAFEGCAELTSVTIPNSVTSIGGFAFAHSGITHINFPNTIRSWGEGLCFDCQLLQTIVLEEGLTKIGSLAFRDCDLREVIVPSTVDSIGEQALAQNYHLNTLIFKSENPPVLEGGYIFWYVPATIQVPCGTMQDYINAWGDEIYSRGADFPQERIAERPVDITYTIVSNDPELGNVNVTGNLCGSNQLTLTANPNEGCRFIGWNDGNTDNPRIITVTEDVSYIAIFEELPRYTITVLANNDEYGTVYGGGTYYEGDLVLFGAHPNVGYVFSMWSDGSTDQYREVFVSEDVTYIAYFEVDPIPIYTITILSDNEEMGTVCCSETYHEGDYAWFGAYPNFGYGFVMWSDGSPNQYRSLQVTEDATYIAYFGAWRTITVLSDNDEMGWVYGGGTFIEGNDVELGAIPNYGFRFVQWNDGNTDNPRYITVTEDTTYTAIFEELPRYTITVLANNDEYGTVDGGGTFYENSQIQISATPVGHYHFVQWADGSTDNPRTIMVTGNATYMATFETEAYLSSFTATACSSYTWNDHTYTESGEYQQTFTASNSVDSIVTLTLTILSAPQPTITVYGELDACNPSSVALTTEQYQSYLWSNDATTMVTSVNEPGYYYVEVTDENGCTGASEQICIGLSNALTDAPQIVVVGMNSMNRNVVSWSAIDNENVNAYRIYRENNVANVYEPMATVEASAQTYWTDETADPSARAYRYKVTAVDECGGESPMSDYHKTMHLAINQGIGNTWNLIWSHYEGFDFGTYKIYRGTMPSNMTMIGEVPSNLNSYTDNTATANAGFYYQVEVVRSTRSRDAEISSRSNIVDNGIFPEYTITVMSANPNRGTVTGGGTYPEGSVVRIEATALEGFVFYSWSDENTDNPRYITVTGDATYIASFDPATSIEETSALEISLFPNPATDILNITSSETISEIEIVNVMGQVVKRMKVNSDNAVCDVEDLTSGVYVVRIYSRPFGSAQGAALRKFVKE